MKISIQEVERRKKVVLMKINNKNENKLAGRYEVIEQIGIGGMSYVYKAYDVRRKKIVAIKMLKEELSIDEDFVKKFKSEALACKDIRHKNVISAYDVIDEENLHYIVMEYLEGTTLNKYINDKGRLSNEETINISIQIAKGIKAAHDKGIIHRDIKPQNIVVSDSGDIKITDFGIARAITSTTKNISVIGTVHYISPEQVRNTKVDFRSDIYSFGCTMYEMITGEVPFEGETPLEIIVSHLRENIKKPSIVAPDIYKSLEKIILKSTRMIPRERYQTIDEMLNDLNKALKDKEGTFIKENVYDEDDEEGKTVMISDEDMKVIKAVSERYTNKKSYKTSDGDLTSEQKAFINRYIENSSFKHHQAMRRVAIGSVIAVILLIIFMTFIALDTRKSVVVNNYTSTASVTLSNIAKSLEGLNIELAKSFADEYGIELNIVDEEFNDTVEHGKIIKIVKNNLDVDKSLDIIVSKGSETIDFTDIDALRNTRWSDMLVLLNERDLTYTVSEIYDKDVPRNYIVGVNKKKSTDAGPLVFTISRGASDMTKTMPDLANKSMSEARDMLEANELVLGNVSFIRDRYIEENHVISQSVESGKSINIGTSVDLIVSCGVDGVEYIADSTAKWHGEISRSYIVSKGNTPNINNTGETMILQIRLMQETSRGIVYTELSEAEEYKVGTILPLVFKDLEGEEGVYSGNVQVVDVVNDVVVYTQAVSFHP